MEIDKMTDLKNLSEEDRKFVEEWQKGMDEKAWYSVEKFLSIIRSLNERLTDIKKERHASELWTNYHNTQILNVRLRSRISELESAMELAAEDELFFFKGKDGTIYPAINVNDTFFYATADAEQVDWSIMPELLERWKKDTNAAVKWVVEKRNMQPIKAAEVQISENDTLRKRISELEKELAEIRDAARPIIKKLPAWDDMGIRDDYKLSRLDIEVGDLRKLSEVLGRTK